MSSSYNDPFQPLKDKNFTNFVAKVASKTCHALKRKPSNDNEEGFFLAQGRKPDTPDNQSFEMEQEWKDLLLEKQRVRRPVIIKGRAQRLRTQQQQRIYGQSGHTLRTEKENGTMAVGSSAPCNKVHHEHKKRAPDFRQQMGYPSSYMPERKLKRSCVTSPSPMQFC